MRNLIHASEAHLADCRFRNLSQSTLDIYAYIESDFITYLQDAGVPSALRSLNAESLRGWAAWHRERAAYGKRGGSAVIHTGIGVLKTWSRWLVREDVLEADYTAKVQRPKSTTTARQPYEAWELHALRGAMAESVTGVRDVAMLALLVDTGIRVHELIGLRLGDVDLQGRRVKIVWGKGRKERYLPFGSSEERDGGRTSRRLREYLRTRRVSPRCAETERDTFWMTYDGFPLTQGGFQSHFRKMARRAGLSHTEVHCCRHTFAINYLVQASLRGNHNPLEELRYLLGHLSEQTYRIYIGQAGQIISEIAGHASIADQLERAPLRVLPGAGPPRRNKEAPAPTDVDTQDGNRRPSVHLRRGSHQPQ